MFHFNNIEGEAIGSFLNAKGFLGQLVLRVLQNPWSRAMFCLQLA